MFNISTDPLLKAGIHEKEITALFKDQVFYTGDGPVFDEPLYLLAFFNRSGSNLLASHLRTTRYFGGFHEQLNHMTVAQQSKDGGCESFPDFIRFASSNYGQGYKTWGFKASWDQIMMLYRFGIHRMYPAVKVIHITRRNLVEQAVSYMIALQTKQWTSNHEGAENVEPAYDYDLLNQVIHDSAMAEAHVRAICTVFDIPHLTVRYEALTRGPKPVIQKIGRFAGVDLSKWTPREPPLKKQANMLNKTYCDRYRADRQAALLRMS